MPISAQETLLPEKKAIYLSILDAALNGPFYIQTEDAMAVFGVRAVYSLWAGECRDPTFSLLHFADIRKLRGQDQEHRLGNREIGIL